jgi:hypothetical protein
VAAAALPLAAPLMAFKLLAAAVLGYLVKALVVLEV